MAYTNQAYGVQPQGFNLHMAQPGIPPGMGK